MAGGDSDKDRVLSAGVRLPKTEEGSTLWMQRIEESVGFVGMQTFQLLHCSCLALRTPPFSRLQEVGDSWDADQTVWSCWKSSQLEEEWVGTLEGPLQFHASCPAWLRVPQEETESCFFRRFQPHRHPPPSQSFPLGKFLCCFPLQAGHGFLCCSHFPSSVLPEVKSCQKRRSWSRP